MSSSTVAILEWDSLDERARRAALARPGEGTSARILDDVRRIVDAVRRDGDAALRRLTLELDGAAPSTFEVGADEFTRAEALLTAEQQPKFDALAKPGVLPPMRPRPSGE